MLWWRLRDGSDRRDGNIVRRIQGWFVLPAVPRSPFCSDVDIDKCTMNNTVTMIFDICALEDCDYLIITQDVLVVDS